jgi:predicted transglutaminase-like cysteine proteinase
MAGGCAGENFSALKSLPPPPIPSDAMPTAQQVMPPFGYIDFCVHHPLDCKGGTDAPSRMRLTPARWAELGTVNDAVNALPEVSDAENYGIGEHWTYATARGGDCEDITLEKRRRLLALGWPAETLLITTTKAEEPQGDGHALLTVVTDMGDFVLDNQNTSIRLWSDAPYHWRARQSRERPYVWVNADATNFAATPRPVFPPIDGNAPYLAAGGTTTASLNETGLRGTLSSDPIGIVSVFLPATPERPRPADRRSR